MIRLSIVVLAAWGAVQEDPLPPQPPYETRERHDPNGINKWYLGREIAHVMGPGGIPWLNRPERESEENPTKCIEALRLKDGDVVADLGAGSGYYSFRMAPKVGAKGKILAVEIQDEMLAELKKRIEKDKVSNVETIKCSDRDPKLPEGSVDLVIMVDVYHELAFPYEVMLAVRKALKPGGRVVLVEYRKEDPKVPIKEVHKMSEEQIRKEMAVVGLVHRETIGILPWQHIAVYTNLKAPSQSGIELGFRMQIPDERKAERAQIARDVEYVMRRRLDVAKVERFELRIQEDLLTLRLPGATPESVEQLKRLAGMVGLLQFRPVAPRAVQERYNEDKFVPEGYEVVDNPDSRRGGDYEAYGARILVQKKAVIESKNIVQTEARKELGIGLERWATAVEFDPEGAKRFDETAERLHNQRPPGLLAIMLDGKIRSLPAVMSPSFRGKAQISGAKDQAEARTLALTLLTGPLAAPLQLESEGAFK